ncbi:hypothetical protein [uncultured Flavobacterium sp.]|uniref:hypothetical protein n=1 Tax=uncultured Flavobacterium sp. TaxID=165435 RepID=UPI0025E080A8|nr:hypothetical protein [uncultured Flavobacterium sp.]
MKIETDVKKDVAKETFSKTENNVQKKESHAKPVDPKKPMKKTRAVEGNTETTIWDNAEITETEVADKSKSETSEKSIENSRKFEFSAGSEAEIR